MQSNNERRIAIIGGGAAGLMAAGTALKYGANVTIFEKNKILGKKLLITGKGRCNLTNNCTSSEFITNVTKNPRFMYASLSEFDSFSTMALFEELGVPLKTERGNRVFPVSDRSADIVNALKGYIKGAEIINEKVCGLIFEDDRVIGVKTNKSYFFDAVILATGGASYPQTGSDGFGYRLAKEAGHTITDITPSLVPLEIKGNLCARMQGLSLKNVGLTIVNTENNKVIYTDFGEMLFTHFGVSGPMILSASAHIRGLDFNRLRLIIDMKPALDERQLDARLLSDFEKYSNRDFVNSLSDLLPSKMIEVFAELCGIPFNKKVNSITKAERQKILSLLKGLSFDIKGFRSINEAIITSGGVDVKEVSPKTMMSKLKDGLYFAGEILDVDAYTGGFNLQIAFSTAYLAGKNSAEQY
ncbi:MAG: NAD(P)/FAD-dependent oxidoreductase [Clostridia bacterium]|nr:NAD(P)/FAD-dependent oxidoreductase [Clostridia bacterium]MBQ5800880.1 NAD(P)/FAD-dependent oxidoreductase [Clostridia bacterium]